MTREPTAIQRALETLNHEKGELRAEVDRLTADNHQLRETLSVAGLWRDLGAENKELRSEVERLRADVIKIVERWEKASFLYLVAGEMTAQETRTALVVVRGIKAELNHLLTDT